MSTILRSFAILLLTSTAFAQTTGVPGINDLTVMKPPTFTPQGSGATSCTLVPGSPTAPFTVAYVLNGTPGMPNALLLNLSPPGPGCVPQYLPFPAAPVSCAGPVNNGTNIWLSLQIQGPWPIWVWGTPNTAGFTRWNFNVNLPGPNTLWAQSVIFDTCAPWGFKFSQALGFSW